MTKEERDEKLLEILNDVYTERYMCGGTDYLNEYVEDINKLFWKPLTVDVLKAIKGVSDE